MNKIKITTETYKKNENATLIKKKHLKVKNHLFSTRNSSKSAGKVLPKIQKIIKNMVSFWINVISKFLILKSV